MKKLLSALGLLIAWQAAHGSQTSWNELYKAAGITVYEHTVKELTYKGEGVLAADLYELLAVVADIPRRHEWVADLQESVVLEGHIDSRVVIYEHFKLPWPAADRDAVVESFVTPDYRTRAVTVQYKDVIHPDKPPQAGIIRMPVVTGEMFFKHEAPGKTFCRYTVTLNVGGKLPEWIVHRVVRDVPARTLTALLAQVERTRGQYAEFIRRHQDKERNAR